MTRFEPAQIGRYYDRHTSAFIRLGQGGSAGAIHRAVWGPGTRTREQAFHYVDDRIAELVRRQAPSTQTPHVIDLGCGIGGSLCYLAGRLPIRGTGVTLSPIQARLAERRTRDAGLSPRVVCVEADYCDLPPEVGPADLAYAIESFVHGAAPDRFFAQCRRILRPGGLLVICDDFKRPAADNPAAARALEQFSAGWLINTLLHPHELHRLARAAGFEHESTVDLTPWLEIGRARDRVLGVLVAMLARLPQSSAFGHLLGGSALQTCLRQGWIGYDFTVFRRQV